MIQINLLFTRSQKPKDAEIEGAEILIELIYSVLVRIECFDPKFCN